MQSPDFWNDNESAAKAMQRKKSLERRIGAYETGVCMMKYCDVMFHRNAELPEI